MVSFSTGKLRKKPFWTNKKFASFSTARIEKILWKKLMNQIKKVKQNMILFSSLHTLVFYGLSLSRLPRELDLHDIPIPMHDIHDYFWAINFLIFSQWMNLPEYMVASQEACVT